MREPVVFLFDEPLSNLDAKLRMQMRVEIPNLHAELGNTMIYVTQNQIEAMNQHIIHLNKENDGLKGRLTQLSSLEITLKGLQDQLHQKDEQLHHMGDELDKQIERLMGGGHLAGSLS